MLLAAAGFVLMRPATDSVYRQMYPRKYSHYIEQYSREYGVDKNLVYAVTRIESNFDPQAVSSADARGLMQMTSDAFDWVQYRMGDDSGVSYEQIFEPKVAIRYGTYMLHLLLEEMGDEKLAICAYHAGMSNVRSWLSQENYSKDGKHLTKYPILIQNGIMIKFLRQSRSMRSFILKILISAVSLQDAVQINASFL